MRVGSESGVDSGHRALGSAGPDSPKPHLRRQVSTGWTTRRFGGSVADRGQRWPHSEAESPYLLGTHAEGIVGEPLRFLGFAFKLQIHVWRVY